MVLRQETFDLMEAFPSTDDASAIVRPKAVRVVGPRLRLLLYLVLGLVALIAPNSIYMASITALEWISRHWGSAASYQDHFYLSMFAVHVALGLLLVVPFLVFGILHMLAARRRRNRRAIMLSSTSWDRR